LYKNKYYHKEVKVKEYLDPFSVQLFDLLHRPDCKIGHFGYDVYFRTPNGVKGRLYKSEMGLERSIKRTIKEKELTFERFVEVS
jgi:hypothetical protein